MNRLNTLLLGIAVLSLSSCQKTTEEDWTNRVLDVAVYQLKSTAYELSDTTLFPRSIWTYHDEKFLENQLGHEMMLSEDPDEVYSEQELKGQRRNCTTK